MLPGCSRDAPGCSRDAWGCLGMLPGCSRDVPGWSGMPRDAPGCSRDAPGMLPGCPGMLPGCSRDAPGMPGTPGIGNGMPPGCSRDDLGLPIPRHPVLGFRCGRRLKFALSRPPHSTNTPLTGILRKLWSLPRVTPDVWIPLRTSFKIIAQPVPPQPLKPSLLTPEACIPLRTSFKMIPQPVRPTSSHVFPSRPVGRHPGPSGLTPTHARRATPVSLKNGAAEINVHFVGAKRQILLPDRKRYDPTVTHHVGNPQFLQ